MLNSEGQHHSTGGVPLHVRLHVVPFREILFPKLPEAHVLLIGIVPLEIIITAEALAAAAIGYMVTKKWLAISPENPLG